MQLDNTDQIAAISQKSGFTIFELLQGDFSTFLPDANHFQPNEKNYYSKEDIDNITTLVHNKQQNDLTIVIENAELMNEAAANTFLKTLEEPNQSIHFVFLVKNATKILPTIKSRAQNYYCPKLVDVNAAPDIEPETLDLAKRYISAKPAELPKIAATITKSKSDARAKALNVIDAAIQLTYKSYFITGNQQFLVKLDKLLNVHNAIAANGHIKLHLVADML